MFVAYLLSLFFIAFAGPHSAKNHPMKERVKMGNVPESSTESLFSFTVKDKTQLARVYIYEVVLNKREPIPEPSNQSLPQRPPGPENERILTHHGSYRVLGVPLPKQPGYHELPSGKIKEFVGHLQQNKGFKFEGKLTGFQDKDFANKLITFAKSEYGLICSSK